MIACASMTPETPTEQWKELCVDAWAFDAYDNSTHNIGVTQAYQQIYEAASDFDGICYLHTDVTIHERGWDRRLAQEFSDPKVAIVGMGGALGIGTPDLYRKPYRIEQLARQQYFSNQSDWQTHGQREEDSRDVAVVDGFCMAIRRSFLDQIGGWKWFPYAFHCYDIAMCLQAIRHGWKIRMVGVNVTHHGGGASTTPEYKRWCEEHGTTLEREHYEPHRWAYDNFREVLPWRV